MQSKPKIAIVTSNSLEALGLASIIERMMPMGAVCVFKDDAPICFPKQYFHFFVSIDAVSRNATFWKKLAAKTIVLADGMQKALLQGFRTLDITKSEDQLIKDIIVMAQRGHTHRGQMPDAVRKASAPVHPLPHKTDLLTAREVEVLSLIVKGFLNKEIASQLNIGLTTVITHRKNLTKKLGIKSVGALTIYAVSNGYIKAEDI